ncbi:MAG: putative lipid II flippase FtsW [Gammaproteobacteria bacterium]|jgi:cell division protein FtsW|nr:putative lipid II flippase FtsW [Gammaproteobacteria bacterium]MDX2460805.1 putative lipid II flippase FtsW [Gammaproteobacteria bacterium]
MSGVSVQQAWSHDQVEQIRGLWQRYDSQLIIAVLALMGIGLVMVASSSISIATRALGDPLYFFWRQSFYVALGLVMMLVATRIPLQVWRKSGPVLLGVGALMLLLVFVPGLGREVNGSMRWLSLGPINLQPSEPMKLFMVLYLAGYLVRRGELVRNTVGGFIRPMSMLAVIGVMLLFEPDYGATVILFTTALGMLFLGGVPFWSFVGWAAFVVVSMGVVVMAAPYRVERLLTFMNPWADPFGSGFQLTQALIAIGSGEWFGVGLGSSVQKLFYLPEAHTDFLFAVLAEELGMVGVLVVILLFTFVVWRAIAIGTRAEMAGHAYGAYLAYGVGLLIGLQAFVNIGVNMGILPTKGLTLPLMSYGGSSLLVNSFAVGLVMRVDHEMRGRS